MIISTMYNLREKNNKVYFEALSTTDMFKDTLISMEEGIKRSKHLSNSVIERRMPITLSTKTSSQIKDNYVNLVERLIG